MVVPDFRYVPLSELKVLLLVCYEYFFHFIAIFFFFTIVSQLNCFDSHLFQ